nr:PREDICTED: clavesin-2-like [Tribolium castaneum]|eukprot:XP_015839738.1 PREDICTED: clavesin-2-like [Tribolium castaneum]
MNLLRVTPEERTQILKGYNVDNAQLENNIEIIKIWKSKQPHLQGDLGDDYFEKLLIKNKFSIERCKEKLENYYTLRKTNEDLLEDYEKILPSQETTTFLTLPRLTQNYEHIVVMKLINIDTKIYDLVPTFKFALAVNEMMLRHDGSLGIPVLIDYTGFALKHLSTWNPLILMRYCNMAEKAYSLRILGLEFINYPSFINKVFSCSISKA